MKHAHITCDNCKALIGPTNISTVTCELHILNYYTIKDEERTGSLEAQLDFCDRKCAKEWLAKIL